MLILYDPTPEPPAASAAVCENIAQREVALDANGKPATTRKMWFILEFAGSLTARPNNGA